jgi:hypothetical protein
MGEPGMVSLNFQTSTMACTQCDTFIDGFHVDLYIVIKWILQNDLVDNSSWHLHKLGLVDLHMAHPFSLPRELK